MGSVFGSITDAIGITDYEGQERAAANAANALERSYALQSELIDFAKEQYSDWQDIYGSVQENLSDYYENLTSEKLVAQNLQSQQQEYQTAVKDIKETMAQRGLTDSGLETATLAQARLENAEERAAVRASGDELVNQQKLNFLSLGLGSQSTATNTLSNAYSTAISATSGINANYTGQYTTISGNNQSAVGTLLQNFL